MKKQFQQSGFGAVGVLVIVLCVALIGAAGYLVYARQADDDGAKNETQYMSVDAMVKDIKSKVTEGAPDVRATGAEDGNYNAYVHYQPEGYDYYTTVESVDNVNYALVEPAPVETEDQEAEAQRIDKETLSAAASIITESLESNGFTVKADYPVEEMFGEGAFYERDNDVCAMNSSWFSVGVACSSKQAFIDAASEVAPFVEAYEKDEDNSGISRAGQSFGLVETGTGETVNDEYANVSVGYAGAYFYKDNGEWVYFGASSEGINCVDTETNALAQKAFADICRQPGEDL